LLTGLPLNSPAVKIQQLRFLAAVAQNDLNITAAAAKLCTTQPAVSKQLKLLEDELGFNIFVRRGRTLTKITPPGERVIRHSLKLLREAQNIKGISAEFEDGDRGTLSIGTTHTQARYVLPPVIQTFPETGARHGFPRDGLLRRYMYDFITLLSPHIDRELVDRAAGCDTQEQVDALFAAVPLPAR
jgi:DNA-binding MarR family transcriptional regulator